MSEMTSLIAFVGVVALALVAVASIVALVTGDGYGHRPSPRRADGWSVGGLPSHPYRP